MGHLGIKHAKYESDDGTRKTVVEYASDEAQLAAIFAT